MSDISDFVSKIVHVAVCWLMKVNDGSSFKAKCRKMRILLVIAFFALLLIGKYLWKYILCICSNKLNKRIKFLQNLVHSLL